jgi:hypothetical protein
MTNLREDDLSDLQDQLRRELERAQEFLEG